MYCFCKQDFYENASSSFEFTDGEQHCQDWLSSYVTVNTMVYLIPLLIGLLNFVSKHILRYMSHGAASKSIADQKMTAALYIAIISFLNLGVISLLVNL
jgi:hypothetical protein